MNNAFPPDVQQLFAEQLASGHYANEDDVLRDALRVLRALDDDAVAIQAAIDDWKNGDAGVPLDEAFASVRAGSHQKPPE